MRYWVITIGGLALCGVSIVGIDWGIYHLMLTGSCASGGPYVSARPCPPGTGGQILAVIGGIFGGLIGVGVFMARGRAGERRESRYPLPLLMWTLLFCTIAGAGLYAALGPAAGDDAPKGTAIFLAALFIPMGLGPVPFAFTRKRSGGIGAIAPSPASAAPPAPRPSAPIILATATPTPAEASAVADTEAESDPIAKIEKLDRLRQKGIITEAEFQMQKQRLLREV